MIKGSCLCGSIAFEAEEAPGMVFNCHCTRCRKAHGAAFATQIVAKIETLKFLNGRDLLSEYKAPHTIRAFCSSCGSRLMNYGKGNFKYLSIAVAAVDGRPELKPIGDCFVPEKLEFIQLDEFTAHYTAMPDL